MGNLVYGFAGGFPSLNELRELAPQGTELSKVSTGIHHELVEVDYSFTLTTKEAVEFRNTCLASYEEAKAYYYRRLTAMNRVRIKRFICLGVVAGLFAALGFVVR